MEPKVETLTVKPDLSFVDNDNFYRVLNFDFEMTLDQKVQAVKDFMSNNNGQGLSDIEKDQLYANAQVYWKDLQTTLRNTPFNFYLNRAQYNFLSTLLLQKLEYDVNSVFIAIELTDFLGEMKKNSDYKNDTDLICFPVDATEMTYIYHLISPYKVKGLTKEAYMFADILKRIGMVSKAINYYDAEAKNLTGEISKWALKFDEGVVYTVPGVE